MKSLIDLCVSRELAERMKALGFEQDTQFWLEEFVNPDKLRLSYEPRIYHGYSGDDNWRPILAMPTAGEIELPGVIVDGTYTFWIKVYKTGDDEWTLTYEGAEITNFTIRSQQIEKNLAEAMGKMWCYLREQGLI